MEAIYPTTHKPDLFVRFEIQRNCQKYQMNISTHHIDSNGESHNRNFRMSKLAKTLSDCRTSLLSLSTEVVQNHWHAITL